MLGVGVTAQKIPHPFRSRFLHADRTRSPWWSVLSPTLRATQPYARCVEICRGSIARSIFVASKLGFRASRDSDRMRGTSSEALGRPNCIPFERSGRANAMPLLLRPTRCFTSAPSEWICVSSWSPRSSNESEAPSVPSMKHTASDQMNATSRLR